MEIAILENDTQAAQLLEGRLREAGHAITLFSSGSTFMLEVGRAAFDVAILGSASTELRAIEIVTTLRERLSNVPLIRVLQKGGETDVVAALKAGADDCDADLVGHGCSWWMVMLWGQGYRARPTPGTGKGEEGAGLMRQRVAEAVC